MSLSHSTKNNSSPVPIGLSGPDTLRQYFWPRQRLHLNESALCIGLSYSRFYRRIQAGTLGLQIRKDEIGERYVLLSDLISYLFPKEEPDSLSAPKTPKRGPGRPRKGTGGGEK